MDGEGYILMIFIDRPIVWAQEKIAKDCIRMFGMEYGKKENG